MRSQTYYFDQSINLLGLFPTCFSHMDYNCKTKCSKVTVKSQQQCINISISCGKCFGLIRQSSGQHSVI